MFQRNFNFSDRVLEHDIVEGRDVVLYPENRLEPILVKSDFGDCLVMTSDLYDLFNQQRISNFGADVVRDFIARNYPTSSAISDQISKMSDNDIMAAIKPRNIQSYSELMSWSKYLNQQIEDGLNVEPTTGIEPTSDPSANSSVVNNDLKSE